MLGACGDAPTAPTGSMDRVAVARVIPSVTDARIRIVVGIQSVAVRDRVEHDLGQLETALTNGDSQKSRFHARVIATLLREYEEQSPVGATDRADVSAITLMLRTVSQVIDGGYQF